MGVHPSDDVSRVVSSDSARTRRFVVLITNGIGGTERRFADIVTAMNDQCWQTQLVVPESLRRTLLDSSSLRADSVVGIGSSKDSLTGFLRSYAMWLLPQRTQTASFHYPLNCLFPLHAHTQHRVTASLTDMRPPRRLPTRDHRDWKYYGILRYSSVIDVLNPDVLSRTREMYPRFARKLRLTPDGTYVDPTRFVVAEPNPRIVLMGRLIPTRKGIEELLDLASDMQDRVAQLAGVTLPIHIVGTGPLDTYVQARAEALRRAGVVIYCDGFRESHDALCGASVALSLQPENNYPSRVVAEALLSGTSVIVRDTGESRLFGSPPGISYVPARLSAESLASAIAAVLAQRSADPALGQAIRRAALQNYHSPAVPRYLLDVMTGGRLPRNDE